ncbi:MAG: hypothetical protein QM754_02205 [Tepidisphaeraceae bacterium]
MAKQAVITQEPDDAFIFVARIRGNAATVTAVTDKLTQALQATQGRPVARPAKAIESVAKPAEASLFDPPESTDETTDVEAASDGATAAQPRTQRGQGPKQDRNAGITVVGDVDFVPSGKTPLKVFFAEKKPKTDMDQVLVICYWLQNILIIPAITPGHVLSGLKHVAEPVPKDLAQTIRNAAKKKGWFNVADINAIRLTTVGENVVEHELGKAPDTGK